MAVSEKRVVLSPKGASTLKLSEVRAAIQKISTYSKSSPPAKIKQEGKGKAKAKDSAKNK